MHMLARLSIQAKVFGGFSLLLLLLLLISGLALVRFYKVGFTIDEVVQQRQPEVFRLKEVSNQLYAAAGALGYFVITAEPAVKEDYSARIKAVRQGLIQMGAQPEAAKNPASQQEISSLQQRVDGLVTAAQEILSTTESFEANYPGIAYANAQINPLTRDLLQTAANLIEFEAKEPPAAERRDLLLLLTELRYSMSNVVRGIRSYLAFRNQAAAADTQLYLDRVETLIARLDAQQQALGLEQIDALEEFRAGLQQLKPHYQRLVELHGSDGWRRDSALVRHRLEPALRETAADLERLIARREADVQVAGADLVATATLTSHLVLLLTGSGVLLGGLLAWFLARLIAKPAGQASQAMAEVATGDGDLTRRLVVSSGDEIGSLADSFNTFIVRVHDLVRHTARATTGVISAVASTNESTGRIAERVNAQQVRIQQVAVAVTEMSHSVSDVAHHAADAQRAAESAAQDALAGRSLVDQSSSSSAALAQRLGDASTAVKRLEEDAHSIGGILDVIKGIAEQTNLLALNAAIEAARAGDLGRGFAVVADEVRILATRTQESTGEIGEMIGRLRDSTKQMVGQMDQGRELACANAQHAKQANEALAAITRAVETITQFNTHIAVAAEEQSHVADDIFHNLEEIGAAGAQTAAETDQAKVITGQLGDLASNLQSLVARFKLAQDNGLDFEAAKSAHLAWRARIRSFLDGTSSLTEKEAVSSQECVLGRWYYADGLARFSQVPGMRELEAPHIRLHQLIRDILALRHSGDQRGAERRFRELEAISADIVARLDAISRQIDGTNAAIG